jgi:integrase
MSLMDGTAPVIAKLLLGSGLRIMEAVRLRVKDIDSQRIISLPPRMVFSTIIPDSAAAGSVHGLSRSKNIIPQGVG